MDVEQVYEADLEGTRPKNFAVTYGDGQLTHCLMADDYAETAGAEPGSWLLLAPPPSSRGGKGKGKATAAAAAPPAKRARASAEDQVAAMSEPERQAMRRALGMA